MKIVPNISVPETEVEKAKRKHTRLIKKVQEAHPVIEEVLKAKVEQDSDFTAPELREFIDKINASYKQQDVELQLTSRGRSAKPYEPYGIEDLEKYILQKKDNVEEIEQLKEGQWLFF